MSAPKGIQAVEWLRRRTPDQRGGNGRKSEGVGDDCPDALRVWRESYLSSLATRNYSVGTVASRRDAINQFLNWAAERELHRAVEITRPILESYQHWLWRCKKANGRLLGWSTQRNRLSILKDFFR